MSSLLVHNMDTAWTSSDEALLQVTVDNQTFFVEGAASNHIAAPSGALNAFAEFVPGSPLDLSSFEELRFWILADTLADGSATSPFYLQFSYVDAHDAAGEEHQWFVPVNQVGVWEQRRIGIQNDRRSTITRFRFTCLTTLPFNCYVAELLAVFEEMLFDLEQALVALLGNQVALPSLTNVALSQTANSGATQVVVPLNQDFNVGNRLLIQGGSSGSETHDVVTVTSDAVAATTTLAFGPNDKVVGTLTAGTATVSVVVPVIVEAPPQQTQAPNPAMILTLRDIREDLERTVYFTQRDSFRPRGTLTVCSIRPAARAYLIDYQLTVMAPTRRQQASIQALLPQRLSMDVGLRVNGITSPVSFLPPLEPTLDERRLGLLAPIYIHVGTHLETAPRQELPGVQQTIIETAPLDAPLDQEGIVLEL